MQKSPKVYKLSIFTSVLPVSDGHWIVYNSFTDKFMVVRRCGELNPRQLPDDPELRENLIAAGAIVKNDVDENLMLRERLNSITDNDRCFQLHVNPTLGCNFRCWYCYEQHDGMPMMDNATLQSLFRLVENKLGEMKGLKELSLSFFGGEPLLGYDRVVRPLIEFCSVECSRRSIELRVHFTTNGFLLNPARVEYLARYKATFQITLDGDRNTHDTVRFTSGGKGSYDTIMRNITKLADVGCHVIMRINYTAANLASVHCIPDDMRNMAEESRKNIRVDLQRVWQDSSGAGDELADEIESLADRFTECGLAVSDHALWNNSLSPCYADYRHQMLINYNGDVFKCTARDFSEANSLGRLIPSGEIKWKKNMPEDYLTLKLSRPECRECRIAPLCGSGCCQKNRETPAGCGCMLGYTEQAKDERILKRFERAFVIPASKAR